MNNALFNRLVESMTQMNEIMKGERQPSREMVIDPVAVETKSGSGGDDREEPNTLS